MLVPGYENVYVLGCFARYATIYSQQVRAINLADALCRSGHLVKDTRVAIVGGSIAGLTAALAFALRGASVRVFEKAPFLFPIQRNPGPRFLHPHVYDWPLGELYGGAANLPILDWTAGNADSVIAKLEADWNAARSQLNMDPVRTGAELLGVRMNGNMPVLKFQEEAIEADIAILAIGFGTEVDRPDLQRYWQRDPLDSDLTKSTVLVSGAGDGALTDVMRLCIQDFHHDEIVRLFADHTGLVQPLKDLLTAPGTQRIEEVFHTMRKTAGFSLRSHQVTFRQGLEVILNAPDGYLESNQSAILNRFIVYLLEQDGKFQRKPGKLTYPIPTHEVVNGRSQYQVVLTNDDKRETVVCHRLLIRHGPEKDENNAKMPKHWHKLALLWEACSPEVQRWSAKLQGQDRTLIPMFSNADFDLSKPRLVIRPRPGADSSHKLRCFVVESTSVPPSSVGGFVKDVLEAHADALGRALEKKLERSEILTEWSNVNDTVEDGSSFGATIARLNAADVVILDITGFEPATMLLVGIRSVLRQGVTLITTQDKFDATQWSLLPFNLKELYPLYITPTTDDINSPSHPFSWLGITIANALTQLRVLPQYQDSPAHENVRRLGPSATYFGRIPAEQGILWLCPFAPGYMKNMGSKVQVAVKKMFGLGVPFERITDIVSPQLVSQRLYSSIRRRDLCVVDWTTWSANVFYELGVRLAVNRFSTVSILAGGMDTPQAGGEPLPAAEREQRRRLVKLLAPIEYGPETEPLSEIKERHVQVIEHSSNPRSTPPAWGDIPFDYTYRLIADLSTPFGRWPGVELLLQSQALIRLGTGGTTNFSSPVLYADGNPAIAADATSTATEMLLAAWFYLEERHGFKNVQRDKLDEDSYREQLKVYLNLGERVIALLEKSSSPEDRNLANTIQSRVDTLGREMRKGASH